MADADHEVQVLGEHIVIRRHDGGHVRLTWEQVQAIKNEAVGADIQAIEVYPAQTDPRIDDWHHRSHSRLLWCLPRGARLAVSFGADQGDPSGL